MLEFFPYISHILIFLFIGIISLILYIVEKKFGLLFCCIGFFLMVLPDVASLALGGPYFAIRLIEQGYSAAQVGLFSIYLQTFTFIVEVISIVFIIVGLIKLAKLEKK